MEKSSAAGWSVAVVDSRPYGGTCALRGCDPKKVLVGAAEAVDALRRLRRRGVQGEALNAEELREFRCRFGVPIPEEHVDEAPFYRPPGDSPEMKHLEERRRALGGPVPARRVRAEPLPAPEDEVIREFLEGSGEREVATTMAFVRLLSRLMRHKSLGPRVVPIIPDEARTFGLDALFRRYGIYSHSERLLGVGIVGPGAGELIAEGTLAVEMGAVARDVADTIHTHPTLSETIGEAAEALLGLATHVHARRT